MRVLTLSVTHFFAYLRAQDLRLQRNRKALAIAPQWYQYRRKSHDLLAWLDDIQRSVDQLPDPPEGERVKVTTHALTHGPVQINCTVFIFFSLLSSHSLCRTFSVSVAVSLWIFVPLSLFALFLNAFLLSPVYKM